MNVVSCGEWEGTPGFSKFFWHKSGIVFENAKMKDLTLNTLRDRKALDLTFAAGDIKWVRGSAWNVNYRNLWVQIQQRSSKNKNFDIEKRALIKYTFFKEQSKEGQYEKSFSIGIFISSFYFPTKC